MTENISVTLLIEEKGWSSNVESKDSEEQLNESSLAKCYRNSLTWDRGLDFFSFTFFQSSKSEQVPLAVQEENKILGGKLFWELYK